MATVSSTSSGSNTMAALGVTNKGIGGLVSGLDTDSLVEALTTGTRAKIAKQGQNRQLLSWKMTAYRSMATALSAFQKKSFSFSSSSSTNIMSNDFFKTFKATSTSDKISVKTTTSTVTGDFTIDKVQQIATNETITNKLKLSATLQSTGLQNGTDMGSNTAFTGQTLKLNVDGDVQTIKLDSLNRAIIGDDENGYTLDANAFETGLQELINKAYGTKNVYVKADEFVANADKNNRYNLVTDEHGVETYVQANDGVYAIGPNNEYVKSDPNAYVKTEVNNVHVSFTGEAGRLKFDSDAAQISIAANNDLLGLSEGQSNRVLMSTKIGDIPAFQNALQGDVFKISINGVEIEVNKNDTLNTLKSRIDGSSAGVTFAYSKVTDEFTLTSKKTGAGENIVMRDVQGNLMNTLFGAQSGNSVGTNWLITDKPVVATETSKLSSADAQKNLASKVSQMQFTLTINGETKTVKADTLGMTSDERTALSNGTLTDEMLLKAINKGIQNSFGSSTTVSFKLDEGKFELQSSDPTTAFSAVHSSTGSDYDALSIMGFTADKIGNTAYDLGYADSIAASNDFSGLGIPDEGYGVFNMTINGVTKEIKIAKSDVKDDNQLAAVNAAIRKAFGDAASGIEMQLKDGKMNLSVKDTNLAVYISDGAAVDETKTVNIYGNLGFTGSSADNLNKSETGGATLADFSRGEDVGSGKLTIDGKEISYESTTSLRELMNSINDAFGSPYAASIQNGKLVIKGLGDEIEISDSGNLLSSMFGITGKDDVSGDTVYKTEGEAYAKHTSGLNAEIVVDGRVISSKSNTFSINGLDVEVNTVSAAGDAPIKVSAKSDPEDVITRLKEWITDYNALLSTLTAAISEDKNSSYAPLTDEQKAEMTADQITTWETEAKKGILRNDSTLRGILSDLRSTLYQTVASAGISLYDIGITTKSYNSSGLSEAGQIEISDESKLRSMLENNPDKVRLLFTDTSEGIATKMNSIIDKAVKNSSVDRGSLITLAGTEALTGDNSSTLGKKIDAIDKYVTSLKERLESEYNRYWKQFSTLETTVQKLNMQSSWLTQM